MKDARLSDSDMIRRLDTTNQVFELTNQQQNYLRGHGISNRVINAMLDMNRDTARLAGDRDSTGGVERISRDRH